MKHLTTETRRHGEDRIIWPLLLRHIGNASSDHSWQVSNKGKSASRSVYAFLRSTVEILKATIREIFDESAYDRFLARTHCERSVSSYRAFMRERENAMARKQKCC